MQQEKKEEEVHNGLIIRLVLGGRPNKGAQHGTITWYLALEGGAIVL